MSDQNEKKTKVPLPQPISVRIERGTADKTEFSFTQPFRIGRDKGCELGLTDPIVSRFHAEFWFADGQWWVLDLQSANGIYVNAVKVERAALASGDRVEIGRDGPVLSLHLESYLQDEPTIIDRSSLEKLQSHYFKDDNGEAGDHTIMIRQAFKQVRKRQRWKFFTVITILTCLLVAAGIIALINHGKVSKQKALAQDIFYAMKSMELDFAPMLKSVRLRQDAESVALMQQYRSRRKKMEQKYDKFLTELEIYQKSISEQERLILRMARIFGECEIKMPDGFVKEVMAYIEKWKSTPRLQNAIDRAKQRGYIERIAKILLAQDLPPQFFFLALQESNFNINAIGPKTRFGIAKGIWQFIPSTAVYYGLKTGPLQHLRRFDPRDERHHFGKSTRAAAKYLRAIYDTKAQASGLLVMASYNWGERRVIRLIEKMPENPQERNFWQLLEKYRAKIPKETYNYVFYIFSAAVIGEKPSLFGFDFDSPLAQIEEET